MCWYVSRQASVETLEMPTALSSNTLPDDDREAMAAQSQQEQGQASICHLTIECTDTWILLEVNVPSVY